MQTTFTLDFATGKQLDRATLKAVCDLSKRHMESIYDSSGYGWDDDDKKSELRNAATRHLIARSADGQVAGFAAFRFTLQGEMYEQMKGEPALLVYDLQVEDAHQRKGLGRHLVRMLEMIALKQRMSYVELFVTTDNSVAKDFIAKKLKGYTDGGRQELMMELDGDAGFDESFAVFSKCVNKKLSAKKQVEKEKLSEVQQLAWSLSDALNKGLQVTSAAEAKTKSP